jgi:tripartite-type tricarboxylate transporter receptor subunit TctC
MLKTIFIFIITLLSINSYSNTFTILIGFPPGGGNYIVGQLISETANRLGYKNNIEIKAGAGGIIGMNNCVSRVEDKNLICIASQAQYVYSIIPGLDDIRKFDPNTLTYIKMIGYSPNILVTSSKNTKSLPELLNDMKTNRPVSFASGALGLRILSGMFIAKTKSQNSVIVEYKGVGPAVTDVIGGQVDYAFVPYTAVKSQISGGLLRILANVGADAEDLNTYPKLQEYIPEIDEDTTMFGFVMGPDVNTEVIDNYNNILISVLQDSQLQKKFKDLGIFAMPIELTSENFKQFSQHEREKFIRQIKLIPIQ